MKTAEGTLDILPPRPVDCEMFNSNCRLPRIAAETMLHALGALGYLHAER